MNNRWIKTVVALSLAVSMCLAGCAAPEETVVAEVEPMEREESTSLSFNIIGGKDVMPIGVFDGPHTSNWNQDGNAGPDFITDEYYQQLQDCGINMICESKANWLTYRDDLIRSLNLAEKYGMGVFVGDHNITWNYDITIEEANQTLSEYCDYPAFCGITLLDEPNVPFHNPDGNANRNLDLYIEMAKVVQKDMGIFAKVNLYSGAGAHDLKSKEKYIKYMELCFDELDPAIYCYDSYPFSSDPSKAVINTILWNMGLYRDKSLKDGKAFWTYLAAGGQWLANTQEQTKKPYFPNEPQFNWYYNALLTYGCQGFVYYGAFFELKGDTVVGTDWDHYEKGLFGEFGNKTQWYYYAQNANKQIAAVDDVLMNSVHKGVIASSDTVEKNTQDIDCMIKSGKFRELQSVDGDALVGCYNYNGKTALYITNFSLEYAQKITLNLNAKHNMKVVQNAEASYVNGKALTLDMAAGEGALVVIE